MAQTIPSQVDAEPAVDPAGAPLPESPVTRPPVRRKRRIGLWLAFAWMAMVGAMAVAPSILPIKDYDDLLFELGPRIAPGARWPEFFGTDSVGRSLVSRIIYGAQASMQVAVASTLLALVVGSVVGVIAGFVRGRLAAVITLGLDTVLSFPPLILLMAITLIGARGKGTIIQALAVLGAPQFARLSRAKTLALVEREFVLAARAMGANGRRIIFRDLLPNVLPSLIPMTFIFMGSAIIAEGSLSYLGFGIPPPTPSWGSTINEGRVFLQASPHITFVPAGVLMMTVLSLRTVGEALNQRFGR